MRDKLNRNIKSYKTKNGMSHLAEVRLAGAEPVSAVRSSIALARKFRDEAEARIKQDRKRPAGERPFLEETLKETIGKYLEIPEQRGGPKPKAQMHLRSALRHIGDETNAELGVRWCREYWERMSETLSDRGTPFSPATVDRHFSEMSAAYKRRAQDLRFDVVSSPFTRIVLPKGYDKPRERRFEPGEEEALLATIREEPNPIAWACLVTLALATGARLQELSRATWSEFQESRGKRYWRIPDEHSKTNARTVPLSAQAIMALDALARLKRPRDRRLFWQYKDEATVSAAFRRIRRKAGLDDFTFHDLRHEAISRLVVERWWMNFHVIARMVGHSSIEVTDRYAHLRTQELISAFEGPSSWQLERLETLPSPFMAPAALTWSPPDCGPQERLGAEGALSAVASASEPPRAAQLVLAA